MPYIADLLLNYRRVPFISAVCIPLHVQVAEFILNNSDCDTPVITGSSVHKGSNVYGETSIGV